MTAAAQHTIEPDLMNASFSSDEDLEEGAAFQTFTVDTFKKETASEEKIVPKCVSFNGRRSRRLSSDNLPFRRMSVRRSSDLTDNSESSYELPTTHRPKQRGSLRGSLSSNSSSADKPKCRLHPKLLPSIFLTLLLLSVTYATHLYRVQHLHSKVQTLQSAHASIEESHTKLSEELDRAHNNMAQYNRMKRLKEEHTENLLKRATEAEDQLQQIIDKVRDESRISVMERYGSNDIRVEMDVSFPSQSQKEETIYITLNPVDMPHSTITFLNQIDSNVWKDASLKLFGGKSLLFVKNDKPTTNGRVPTVLFAEKRENTSSLSKHNEYTLSFGGSKQGELYINLVPSQGGFGIVDFKSHGVVEEMKGGGVVVRDVRVVTNGK